MELDGTMSEEIGLAVYVDNTGNQSQTALEGGVKITANFTKLGWRYRTKISYCTFEIMETEKLYCRGIVFSLKDVK